ncbi:MAG: tetratricopeptide repeat protein [Candidatus Muiribacteriota bacterium]
MKGLFLDRLDIKEDISFRLIETFSENSIYFGSDKGIFKYDGQNLNQLWEEKILDMCKVENQLYFSTLSGIYIEDSNHQTKISSENGFKLEYFDNNLYFFNEKGLFFLDSSDEINSIRNLSNKYIYLIKTVGDFLYIVHMNGVLRFDGESLYELNEEPPGVEDIFKIKDNIFLLHDNIFYKIDKEGNIADKHTFDGDIRALDYDLDYIYILTYDNLYIFDGETFLPFFDEEINVYETKRFYNLKTTIRAEKKFIYIFNSNDGVYEYVRYLDDEKNRFYNNLRNAKEFFSQGDFASALELFKLLYKMDSDNYEVCLYKGKIYREEKDFLQAYNFYMQAFRLRETEEVIVEFAGLKIYFNQRQIAHSLLVKALQKSGQSLNIFIPLIDNLMMMKNYDEALFYTEKASEKYQDIPVLWKRKLQILNKKRKYEKLENLFKVVFDKFRYEVEYVYMYIDFLVERLRFAEALEFVEKTLENAGRLGFNELPLLIRKNYIAVDMKNFNTARKEVEYLLNNYPERYECYLLAAYLNLKNSRGDLARQYLSAASRNGMPKNHWRANYIEGELAFKRRRFSDAIKFLEKSVEKKGDFPYSRYYLAETYARQRMFFAAIRQYRIIIDYWPEFEFIDDVIKMYYELE